MFGGFNLSAGFNQLQEFGEKFQKIKEDIEHNIESSLRPDSSTAANQAGADTRTEEAALDGWGDFDGFINTDSNVEARKGASDTSTSQQTSGESAAHAALKAREVQLERKFEEVAAMQEVTQQLMARNEELARKAQKISEEDLDSMQAEFEARLGTAERKVYALTKERDALRRGTEKLSTVNELLKEKDGIIAQVMEEGEKLSKKQLAQESTIRKLRMQLKELEGAKLDAEGRAAAEATKIEAANRAKAKAEGDIAALREQHRTELDAQKQHYEGLLQRSRTAQLESEERAASSAKEGLARKVKEAEARAESLAETVEELRLALERQRAAADLREDLLQREIADMERRCQAAEARHEELAGKLPEATRPLLRQIEAMQSAAAAQQEAWAGAERSLSERVDAAEARAATAIERERSAGERLQAANARLASMAAALEAVRSEAAETAAALEAEQQQRYAAEARARKADEQLKQANDRVWALQREREDVENTAKAAVAAERQASLAAMVAAEERLQAAESRLQAVQNPQPSTPDRQRAGAPPALAGPGYKWVLMREGEEPRSRQQPASSSGSTPRAAAGSGSGSVGFSKGMAAELERLRDAVRIKEDQLASVQQQISSLEATRDSLAEELVAVSQTAEAGAEASRELERLRAEHEQVHRRLQASIEMLGERDERIEELRADVADVKQLYKDQIEFMVEQLAKQNVSVPS
ncbi:hypothetical protein WJX72_004204 [[Myrmecia] bisecta]|uniref:TATA element modulatory factor 1 TATA binding domain-containing protein n=1 Tax=[Myrmecia] bisecta TaxID=41462 RepID=A0AAW1R6Q0_9CHLO